MIKNEEWNIEHYQTFLSSLPKAGHTLLELLNAQPNEKILDLGCGDGSLTEKIQSTSAHVLGIDISPAMIQACKMRKVNAQLLDARHLEFDEEFDAVFSHAALHWIQEADLVVQGVARSLKKGGRFVAECGGHGNVTVIATALIEAITNAGYAERMTWPWHYHDPDSYKMLLERHGLQVDYISLVPRLAVLPNGMREWLKTFTGQLLSNVPPALHGSIFDEAEKLMRPILCSPDGVWHADYVRLWVVAKKPF